MPPFSSIRKCCLQLKRLRCVFLDAHFAAVWLGCHVACCLVFYSKLLKDLELVAGCFGVSMC